MNMTLQDKIVAEYPKIFKDIGKSSQETCMAFGLEVGDGWFDIINHLCYALTWTYTTSVKIGTEHFPLKAPQVVADQVKEKFGTLRFYYHLEYDEATMKQLERIEADPSLGSNLREALDRYQNYFDGIIHMAEVLSEHTCEVTGKSGEMHVTNGSPHGWRKVLNREFAKTDEFYVNRNYQPVEKP